MPIHSVLSINIDSSINPATYNFLETAYKQAKKKQNDLLLLKLNTPGGLISTTKDIISLMNQQAIPTLVWITPAGASATSAGALIASGAHFVFMSEGTNIGAATPISIGKDIEKDSDMRNKAINDLAALVKSLSQMRQRKQEGYVQMIKKAKSFSAEEALKEKLINGLVNSQEELFNKLNNQEITLDNSRYTLSIKNPKVESLEMDLGQQILNIFSNPSSAYILFLIGAALIYLELQAPGGFIAGSIGVLSLILAGIGFQVLPLNFGAFGLILLAFCLFIIEIFVTSYGILSIAGLISLITGSLFLFRTDDAYLHFSHELIFSASGAVFIFLLFLGFIISRDQKNVGKEKFNDLVGKDAIVKKVIREDSAGNEYLYQVKVNGEFWKARSNTPHPLESIVTIKKQHHNLHLEI